MFQIAQQESRLPMHWKNIYRQPKMAGIAKSRRLMLALLASATVITGIAISAPAASASLNVSGHVECLSMPVEGVWIAANSGGSGWASWSRAPSDPEEASFSYNLPNGGSFSVHVGCGGSPQNWAVATYSYNSVSGSGHNFYCYDYAYEDPYYGHCTNS
jgi:hypothetical protein